MFMVTFIVLNYSILALSIMILVSFHPIFMGMLMLSLCLFVSILMSLTTHSWLSFLLFYLMSGGILMLLLYMSCFSFNPIFKKSTFALLFASVSYLIVWNQNYLTFKSYFSDFSIAETGMSLSSSTNMWMFLLISLLMFMCFFNISKILTSFSFSMRKFFLSSNMSTANSY